MSILSTTLEFLVRMSYGKNTGNEHINIGKLRFVYVFAGSNCVVLSLVLFCFEKYMFVFVMFVFYALDKKNYYSTFIPRTIIEKLPKYPKNCLNSRSSVISAFSSKTPVRCVHIMNSACFIFYWYQIAIDGFLLQERKLLRQNRDLKKKLSSVQLKLKENKVDDKKVIEYLSTGLNEMQLEFIKMQITNRGRPKHGRRYTSKQKSMCLAMYKQGPKLYRFLETGFVLPTKKTLGRHSANVLFTAGVDFKVLKAVKNAVSDWPEEHKYCTILWDEVSLKEHLDYCSAQDIIEGFVQMSSSQIPKFATHALTFMVRGIKISFKQSIGFFYTNGLFAFELVELIKIMIGATITLGKNYYCHVE